MSSLFVPLIYCPSLSCLIGERPFICLICLSAFTTKANCERHLKVHTDTLNGLCHGCGFVSTTRDILYSHLVTSHMVCQPGSRSEVYSPGPGLPKLPLSTGKSYHHLWQPIFNMRVSSYYLDFNFKTADQIPSIPIFTTSIWTRHIVLNFAILNWFKCKILISPADTVQMSLNKSDQGFHSFI